jgi:hypothetical protein
MNEACIEKDLIFVVIKWKKVDLRQDMAVEKEKAKDIRFLKVCLKVNLK